MHLTISDAKFNAILLGFACLPILAFRFGFLIVYREQLDSLLRLKWPSLVYDNVPWALHAPSCTLQSWSPVGFDPESSLSPGMVDQSALSLHRDLERRSVTSWEVESAREDGELPTTLPVAKLPDESATTSSGLFEHVDHSKSLAMISKNVTPSKAPARGLRKNDDDLDLLLESESEIEEQTFLDQETENASHVNREIWKEFAAREFALAFSKTCGSNTSMRLNAKVNPLLYVTFLSVILVTFSYANS